MTRKTGKFIRGMCMVLTIIIFTFCLTGCNESEIGKSVVDISLKAVRDVDIETIKEKLDTEKFEVVKLSGVELEDYGKYVKNILNRIDYKIIQADKIDGKKVIVRTEITTSNMTPAIENWVTRSVSYMYSSALSLDQDISIDKMNKRLMEMLAEETARDDLETITETVDIVVIKEKGRWKIDINDKLLNIIYGGSLETFKTMGVTLNAMF